MVTSSPGTRIFEDRYRRKSGFLLLKMAPIEMLAAIRGVVTGIFRNKIWYCVPDPWLDRKDSAKYMYPAFDVWLSVL